MFSGSWRVCEGSDRDCYTPCEKQYIVHPSCEACTNSESYRERPLVSKSIILPEVNLVSIQILKGGQLTIFDCLNFLNVNPLRPQVFDGLTDVLDFEAETRVAAFFQFPLVPGGNEFEENAVDIESGDKIPRSES
jgi:hypothetical protein